MQSSVHRQRWGLAMALSLLVSTCSAQVLDLSASLLDWVSHRYGRAAVERLHEWQDMSERLAHDSDEMNKLVQVNSFFNRVRFMDDLPHYKQSDYWATPVELLAENLGDCEDYAIAKFYTLRAVGVEPDKLRITYVKALKYNQAHMVLTYLPAPDADPLVLDNLVSEIRLASERSDLLPVYSFNAEGLWAAKMRGAGVRIGKADDVRLWVALRERLQAMRDE